MFLDDAYVIDSYNRKVLKVSNDISTELFNLEKEDIVTENKDFVSIDDYTKNLIKKYLKISDTEIEKIVNRKDYQSFIPLQKRCNKWRIFFISKDSCREETCCLL